MSFTIIQTSGTDTFYLNHAYMSSLSFGSEEMAWVTDDECKADKMLERCKRKHNDESIELLPLM